MEESDGGGESAGTVTEFVDRPEGFPGEGVGIVARRLIQRLPALTDELVDRIVAQVDEYRELGPVPREDLYRSCRANLEFMLGHLGGVGAYDLSAPRRTGRRRARQGAPLAAIQSAFRIGFALMWETVVAEARRSGDVTDATLVTVAGEVWTLNEMFTTEMASSYRDALTEQIVRQDQERSALVEALLRGQAIDTATVWAAADLLGLPYHGLFVVVAAEVPTVARQALPNIDARLLAKGVGSAWRLLPDVHVGIVSVRSETQIGPVVETLQDQATMRVGVSPPFTGLDDTPHALHLARIAMISTKAGERAVNVFDRAPLPALVASSPSSSQRMAEMVLGPLTNSGGAERDLLIETLETYFAVGGSTVEAAQQLFCHPNTVRHRLRRIEQHTGRSLDDPRGSAELYVALEALRRLPDLG